MNTLSASSSTRRSFAPRISDGLTMVEQDYSGFRRRPRVRVRSFNVLQALTHRRFDTARGHFASRSGFIPALAQPQQGYPVKAVRIVVPSSAGDGHPVFLQVAKADGLIAK